MRKRELRVMLPDLRDDELEKLHLLYYQTRQDNRRELVEEEIERRGQNPTSYSHK